jgi:hypothetical protein
MKSGFLKSAKGIGETRYKQITVRTQGGLSKPLEVAPKDTIEGLKAVVASRTNVPEHLFTLTYKGEPLEESSMASSYDIPDGESLVMLMKSPAVESAVENASDAVEEQTQRLASDEYPISVPEATKRMQQRLRQRLAARAMKPGADIDEVSTTIPSDGDTVVPKPEVYSNSVKRRSRQKRTAARLAAAEVAPSGRKCNIRSGEAFTTAMPGPIFASSKSWEEIGKVEANIEVVASGPLEIAGGHVMMPIKPEGAIEWRILAHDAIDSDVLVSCDAPKEPHESNNRFPVFVRTAKGF